MDRYKATDIEKWFISFDTMNFDMRCLHRVPSNNPSKRAIIKEERREDGYRFEFEYLTNP